MIDTHELAWAAGFYDGEGSTSLETVKNSGLNVRVSVYQVDRRVLDRFQAAVGVGNVRGPYQRGPGKKTNWQPYYGYSVSGIKAKHVLEKLWPYLGEVKKNQARIAVERWMSRPLKRGVYKGMEESVGAWGIQ